ncbi:hypothetical protein H8E77_31975 [bacterium]|nr:hypothetical protein [bacterium]
MKTRLFLIIMLACSIVFLSTPPAMSWLYEWDDAVELDDWDFSKVQKEVKDGKLILNGEAREAAYYKGVEKPEELGDYEVEAHARSMAGGYFAFHVRMNDPGQSFYLLEISFGSNTVSAHSFVAGVSNEITPGGNAARPKRPESKDIEDGKPAYIIKYSVEGDMIKYWLDGKLILVTEDDTWASGPPGLSPQANTMQYEWVRIDSIPEGEQIPSTKKQLAVDGAGKLAVTWGTLKEIF